MAEDSGPDGGEITLTLGETLGRFVKQQVNNGGYTDAAAYLHHLVREEQRRQVRERVTALLKEGAAAPLRERSGADWRVLRTAVSKAAPAQ